MKKRRGFKREIKIAERPYEYWLETSEDWRGEKHDRNREKAFLEHFEILRPENSVNDPDMIDRFSLYEEGGEYDVIYCDDDEVRDGIRIRPFFRPEYGPETFAAFRQYPCLYAVRKEFYDKWGDSWEKHIKPDRILHIPEVLCHFVKERPLLTGEEAEQKKPEADDEEVSIIILSKDHPELLERCVTSIYESDPPEETHIIVVDNGSSSENRKKYRRLQRENKIDYVTKTSEFNYSALNNYGEKRAFGRYLIFMNDDIEVPPEQGRHFIQRLAGQASKEYAGAVGIKLLYPGSRDIQHCGITMQLSGPAHKLCGYSDEEIYYFGINRKTVNFAAVTGACLCIKKDLFEKLNGFDEKLPLAYNDVDLCIRLLKRGFYNICINDIYLYHHESASRRDDITDVGAYKKLKGYRMYFYERHREYLSEGDPYLNMNLTKTGLDYCVDVKEEWETSGIEIEAEEDKKTKRVKGILYNVDSMKYRLSDAYLNEDFFEASGWIFFQKRRIEDYTPGVLISSDEKKVLFPAVRTFRKDVEEVFPKKRNACMSGFYSRISYKALELEGFAGRMDMMPVLRDKKGRIFISE